MRYVRGSTEPNEQLPQRCRVILDGLDVTDLCDGADDAEGWADCHLRGPTSTGAVVPVEGSKHRRSGKVEFRKIGQVSPVAVAATVASIAPPPAASVPETSGGSK